MAAVGKRPGWESAAQALLDAQHEVPFEWGRADCFTLVVDHIEAVTGRRLLEHLRGYRTELGAARMLRRHKFGDLGQALASVLEEIPPAFAQRGDVGVVPTDAGPSGVIITGRHAVGRYEHGGLVFVPAERVIRAFRV